MKRILSVVFSLLLFVGLSHAQPKTAEVSLGLNEKFFDVFLDTVFESAQKPEFQIGQASSGCAQKLVVQREMNGVRTAVRFRDGKITAPLAFTGNYDAPFIGCINFEGWADTVVNLEFNAENKTLYGRVKVTDVRLNNVPALAGGVLAKFVQGSIDDKINPVEILQADKLSVLIPLQQTGNLRLKPVGISHEINDNLLNIFAAFEFVKE